MDVHTGGNPYHVPEYLHIYLCILSGCCPLHHSHPLTTATAASCQHRTAAAEGEGRRATSSLTALVLAEGDVGQEVEGGEAGELGELTEHQDPIKTRERLMGVEKGVG